MKENYENYYQEIENKHPWFVARRKLFRSLLPTNKNLSILDFGCGSARFLNELGKYGYKHLEGVEVSESYNAAKIINNENIRITKDIQNKKYDVILMMDVLEHIEDDLSCLLSMKNHLSDGGMIIASVPAYNFLWSNHDVINMHYRRYTRKSLRKVISESSYTIDYMTNWNMTILPFIALSRLINKSAKTELHIKNKILFNLLYIILLTENQIFKTLGLPFGLSIISSFRK